MESLETILRNIEDKNSNEPEFLQAVEEVLAVVYPLVKKNRQYQKMNILGRIVEPERVVSFRVPWLDDRGKVQVNRGYRVQMNSAIGPYKGGLRFHPTVNLSILKFLAFEQTFKNSLTTLPMGGGKGGADFDPKGKSDNEVMKFCQSFMTELSKHIGPNTDVPAGDIGVGAREIGYMYGQYKRLRNETTGTLTGKSLNYGGSLIRPEATGYGAVYFVKDMLATRDEFLDNKVVAVSGSGNVAQYTVEKMIEYGAKVVTLSDSTGVIYDKAGLDKEKLAFVMQLKNKKRGRIKEYAKKYKVAYKDGGKPWAYKCDVAIPAATENELDQKDARNLLKNGVLAVGEAANMPSTPEAIDVFVKSKILFAPGKAVNAGGVAVSGLEMSQNSIRQTWTREEVDEKLQEIMHSIHETCFRYGKEGKYTNYVKGANIGGFLKVADAMIEQGVV